MKQKPQEIPNEIFDKVVKLIGESSKFQVYLTELIKKAAIHDKKIDLLFSENRHDQQAFHAYTEAKYEEFKQALANGLDRHEEQWHGKKKKFPQSPKEFEEVREEKLTHIYNWLRILVGIASTTGVGLFLNSIFHFWK
jgi:hypothetical protein